jgi:hypothetical protein
LKGIKQLGSETVEKATEETGKIFESIITGRELLGDITPMSENDLQKSQIEDERKKQQEIADLKSEIGQGRNVEQEVEQIRTQKEKQEEEEEKIFLENIRRQREAERQEQIDSSFENTGSSHHKNKGGNPHKKSQPSDDSMSQTNEFSKKPD